MYSVNLIFSKMVDNTIIMSEFNTFNVGKSPLKFYENSVVYSRLDFHDC